eukprot:618929_1
MWIAYSYFSVVLTILLFVAALSFVVHAFKTYICTYHDGSSKKANRATVLLCILSLTFICSCMVICIFIAFGPFMDLKYIFPIQYTGYVVFNAGLGFIVTLFVHLLHYSFSKSSYGDHPTMMLSVATFQWVFVVVLMSVDSYAFWVDFSVCHYRFWFYYPLIYFIHFVLLTIFKRKDGNATPNVIVSQNRIQKLLHLIILMVRQTAITRVEDTETLTNALKTKDAQLQISQTNAKGHKLQLAEVMKLQNACDERICASLQTPIDGLKAEIANYRKDIEAWNNKQIDYDREAKREAMHAQHVLETDLHRPLDGLKEEIAHYRKDIEAWNKKQIEYDHVKREATSAKHAFERDLRKEIESKMLMQNELQSIRRQYEVLQRENVEQFIQTELDQNTIVKQQQYIDELKKKQEFILELYEAQRMDDTEEIRDKYETDKHELLSRVVAVRGDRIEWRYRIVSMVIMMCFYWLYRHQYKGTRNTRFQSAFRALYRGSKINSL